jgi:hypothetical protein
MGYVSEGSEGYRTFRLESLGFYAACRDGTTHPICILTFHLGGDDAASDRRQHLLLRRRPVAGEQTPPPSAAAGQFPIIPSQFLRFFLVGPARDCCGGRGRWPGRREPVSYRNLRTSVQASKKPMHLHCADCRL